MKKSISFLIVDDDAEDILLFVNAVREVDATIDCRSAGSGEEALEWLTAEGVLLPDFIFLDLRMPGIDGKKCLLEIKKDDRLKNIPVIIYTISKAVDEANELTKLGAFYFISKPRNAGEIFFLISFVLDEYASLLRRKPSP